VPGRRRRGGERLLPAGGTRLNLSGQAFQDPDDTSTPLIIAARHGHTGIVSMILERAPKTTVYRVDAMGFTALLAAAEYHHANIIQLLADRGANVSEPRGYAGVHPSAPRTRTEPPRRASLPPATPAHGHLPSAQYAVVELEPATQRSVTGMHS